MSRRARCARAIFRTLRFALRTLFAFTQTARFWAVILPVAEVATLLVA